MMIEQYTLILRHEAIICSDKVQIDPPLVHTHSFERRYIGTPIVIDKMMDDFKHELLRRRSEWEGGEA